MHIGSYKLQLVMSLPAMSSELRFCTSRMGGTAGFNAGPRQHSMDRPFLCSFVRIMGLRKQSSGYVGVPISGSEALFSVCRCNHSCDYWKLIRKWAWFESWIFIGWLQWHLCEVRSFKLHVKWKYGNRRLKVTSTEANNWLTTEWVPWLQIALLKR